MNHIKAFFVLIVMLAVGSVAAAAPTEVDVTVPAGASETQIASFQTPAGAVSSEVVVGRFLIDYPAPASTADEIVVQVQTHDLTQTRFQWAAVTLNDPFSLGSLEDKCKGAGDPDRVIADLFVSEVPAAEIATAATHRLIEVRVLFSSTYAFDAPLPAGCTAPSAGPHTWQIRVFGLRKKCTGDGSTVCSVDAACTPTPGGACNTTPSVRYTGFKDEGTDLTAVRAAVTKPKVDVTPTTVAFGNTQINLDLSQTPVEDFSWSNLGTDAFNPTGGLAPSGAGPYSLFSAPVLTTLKPGETSPLVQIQFHPTQKGSGGPNQETLTITGTAASSGAALSSPVQLEGTGVSLSSILLLDVSGSMRRNVDTGSYSSPEDKQRLWAAKQAGLQLFDAFDDLTSGEGQFGVYTFPDPANAEIAGGTPTSSKVVPISEASLISGPVTTALGPVGTGGLQAAGGTPMHAGLVLAEGDLPNGSGTDDRPSVLLLSDGKHNTPREDEQPLTVISSYDSKAARIFSVPFGTPSQAAVDHAMLEALAAGTSGETLPADPANPGDIQKAFRGALREWLGLRDVADPESTIAANQSKAHEVCLDDKAYQAVFVLDWYDQRDDAISFTLETPLGATLTPSSPDLSFSKNKSYAMYVVYGRHIRGGKGAGLWKLKLSGSGSLPGTLGYQYSAMTQAVNRPKPSWSLLPGYLVEGSRAVQFYAGEPWMLELPVDPELKARIEASDTGLLARLDAPTQSVGTFLAKFEVKREWVFQTHGDPVSAKSRAAAGEFEQRTGGDPLPIAARKAEALAKFADKRFVDKRSQSEVRFRDDGQDGDRKANDNLYTAVLPSSRFDGIYDVNILLDLAPTRRGCSNIDTHVSVYVPANMAAAAVAGNVQWTAVTEDLYFDPSVYRTLELGNTPAPGRVRQAAVFMAKDKLGNYLGPGQANQISFEAKNARLVGQVIDNWDGSYVQVVEYEKGADPVIMVSAGGFTSEPVSPKPEPFPPSWFWWLLIVLVVVLLVVFLVKKLASQQP